MQFPINIVVHRSRLLARGLLLLAALLLAVILAFPRSTGFQLVFSLLAIALLWQAWRQLTPAVIALRLHADGTMAARLASATGAMSVGKDDLDWVPLRCLPGATVHPWLTVMRLQHDAGRQWSVILFSDSTGHESSRRLRVFLRWQLAPGMHDNSAPFSDDP